VQSRLTYITGSRDDIYRSDYAKLGSRATIQRIQQVQPTVDYKSIPSLETDTLEGDIQVQIQHLMNAGLDKVLYVDLSQPEIGIPVVRVLIPGTSFAAYHKGRQVPLNEQTRRRLMKRMIVRNLMREHQ
jgi:ribosomal protein S12 methylthiotransferase accessory factor